jgi:tRNA pseudouridine55 synthase
MTTNNGALFVDKEGGLTSHDVVAKLRKILNERRIGHAGTLDPMATGLLVLAVGSSTRLLRFAAARNKRYTGVVQLGVATDSLDADGAVVETRDVPSLDQHTVDRATAALTGSFEQVPPMVSAKKIDGKRLHQLAREGVEVQRRAVPVAVTRFVVAPTELRDRWSFEVDCSVGTYVRVLLSDWAHALGTVGHLTALRRTASGHTDVTHAQSLAAIAEAVDAGTSVLAPPRRLVEGLGVVTIDDVERDHVLHGRPIEDRPDVNGDELAAVDHDDDLVAVMIRRKGQLWPSVVVADR